MSTSKNPPHDPEAADNREASTDADGDRNAFSSAGTIVDEPSRDPNVVDWDGPDDPANPLNWPGSKKTLHVAIVSLFTLAA